MLLLRATVVCKWRSMLGSTSYRHAKSRFLHNRLYSHQPLLNIFLPVYLPAVTFRVPRNYPRIRSGSNRQFQPSLGRSLGRVPLINSKLTTLMRRTLVSAAQFLQGECEVFGAALPSRLLPDNSARLVATTEARSWWGHAPGVIDPLPLSRLIIKSSGHASLRAYIASSCVHYSL